MNDQTFAGALLRLCRLERNWSQETLCRGICTVSYLSKIEQGKVVPNEALLKDLFQRMDIAWQTIPQEEGALSCEEIYDLVLADDKNEIERRKKEGLFHQEGFEMGSNCLDYLILRAYCCKDVDVIPLAMHPLLDDRQKCLLHLLKGEPKLALQSYPCALAARIAGAEAYGNGEYTSALEYLQLGYDMACQNGYVRIMMYCQIYMANCYSDLRNVPNMLSHYKMAKRLARALGEVDLLQTIEYNTASTKMECGEYEAGYTYFSALKNMSVLDLHKLAICCEKTGRHKEAMQALDSVQKLAAGIEREMCALVRYRLEHSDYLKHQQYGEMLLSTFNTLKKEYSVGYARFHLPWVEEWCTANRQYRLIYEIMRDFL